MILGYQSETFVLPSRYFAVAYLGGQGGHVPRAPLLGGAKKEGEKKEKKRKEKNKERKKRKKKEEQFPSASKFALIFIERCLPLPRPPSQDLCRCFGVFVDRKLH